MITDSIIKGITISLVLARLITTDFRKLKKLAAAYSTTKGCKYWPGVINVLEPIEDKNGQ